MLETVRLSVCPFVCTKSVRLFFFLSCSFFFFLDFGLVVDVGGGGRRLRRRLRRRRRHRHFHHRRFLLLLFHLADGDAGGVGAADLFLLHLLPLQEAAETAVGQVGHRRHHQAKDEAEKDRSNGEGEKKKHCFLFHCFFPRVNFSENEKTGAATSIAFDEAGFSRDAS